MEQAGAKKNTYQTPREWQSDDNNYREQWKKEKEKTVNRFFFCFRWKTEENPETMEKKTETKEKQLAEHDTCMWYTRDKKRIAG